MPRLCTSLPRSGFTLIELSIVLVIIGLIMGGILSGKDLIDAASQRAQISQIEKYNTAVRTFQGKYGYLPGDIPDPYATQFGFSARGLYEGEGDGNGVIESNCANTVGQNRGDNIGCGEIPIFWADLSTANLLDYTIKAGAAGGGSAGLPNISGHSLVTTTSNPNIYQWLPPAKLGQNVFVYLYSVHGLNYFAISSADQIDWMIDSAGNPGITVQQAYNIDKKIDDGLPQSGNVIACYENGDVLGWGTIWAAGGRLQGTSGGSDNGGSNGVAANYCVASTAAVPYAATNCFDNNNTAGTQKYSISQNATAQNCALSFKFQ